MIIDAHQHVWNLERARYDWLGKTHGPINRTVEFAEIRPQLQSAGIDATVLVQSADNPEDTEYMLSVAKENAEVAAVVGYVPLDNPDTAAEMLNRLNANPHFVGVRNLIHDQTDPDWLLRPNVDEGLGVLERANVPFDIVSVLPRHLEIVPILSERHPDLRMVIDHLSKPPLGQDTREPWWSLIERAAENPLVHAKVSGLYPTSGPMTDWSSQSIRPFFERALDIFSADRLMYGGDWPISVNAGGYQAVWEGLSELFDDLTAKERAAIEGDTATGFYRIDAALLKRAERNIDSSLRYRRE
ncbi:amidohydrolase family protein [Arthrobacter tecti]